MLGTNETYIKKNLVKKILKANKKRNILIIVAIILTTIFLTTVVSTSRTMNDAMNLYNILKDFETDSQGSIIGKNISEEILQKDESIEKYGVEGFVSKEPIKNKDLGDSNGFVVSAKDKYIYDMFGVVPTEGSYPEKSDQVLIPTWAMNYLDVYKIGDEVKLLLSINGKEQEFSFKVCGFYDSFQMPDSQNSRIYVSKDFTEGKIVQEQVFIKFKEDDDLDNKLEKMKELLNGENYNKNLKYNEKNISNIKTEDSILGMMLIGILAIGFMGYIIISNVFNISINKDVRFYGLLKTIGVTPRQIKVIVLRQGFYLSFVGIPLGLAASLLINNLFLLRIMDGAMFKVVAKVDNSIVMIMISIIFSLSTVYISCLRPAIIASKLTAAEALKARDNYNISKKIKKGKNGGKLYNIAWRHISKNPRKILFTLISVFISSFVLNYMINISRYKNSKDVSYDNSSKIDASYYRDAYSGNNKIITEELQNEINEIEGVEDVKVYYEAYPPTDKVYNPTFSLPLKYEGDIVKEHKPIDKDKVNTKDFWETNREGYFGYDNYIEGFTMAAINEDRLAEELKGYTILDGAVNKEKFLLGNYMVYDISSFEETNDINTHFKAGEKITLNIAKINYETGDIIESKPVEFEIMAIVKRDKEIETNYLYNLKMFNISMDDFRRVFPEYEDYISTINVNYKEDVDYETIDKELSMVISKLGYSKSNLVLNFQLYKSFIQFDKEYKVVGWILVIILMSIALLNFSNTIVTDLLVRKREFGILESIGMTRKQIKKTLAIEGIYYSLLVNIPLIPISYFFVMSEIKKISNDGVISTQDIWIYVISIILVFILNLIFIEFIIYLANKERNRVSLIYLMKEYE